MQNSNSTNVKAAGDELTGALIGLAKTCANNGYSTETLKLILDALVLETESISEETNQERKIREMTEKIHAEKHRISPGCASCAARCGNTDDYPMEELLKESEAAKKEYACVLEKVRLEKIALLKTLTDLAPELRSRLTDSAEEEIALLVLKSLAYIAYDLNPGDCEVLRQELLGYGTEV